MVRTILFVLCLSLFTLTTTSLQAAPSKPTAKQFTLLSEVARCERGVLSLGDHPPFSHKLRYGNFGV